MDKSIAGLLRPNRCCGIDYSSLSAVAESLEKEEGKERGMGLLQSFYLPGTEPAVPHIKSMHLCMFSVQGMQPAFSQERICMLHVSIKISG